MSAPGQPLIWITGTHGLIGHALAHNAAEAAPANARVKSLTREELDLARVDAIQALYNAERPSIILHCAALTKTPFCQEHPDLAWKINYQATGFLADLGAKLVLLSTDLVFDGQSGNYSETSPVNPLNVYAETKAAAEQLVLKNPAHIVVRTSLNGGFSPTGDRSFNEEMRRAWQAGKTLRLFIDEYRAPIMAEETAKALWELVSKNAAGLFHLAGSERLSRYDVGRLVGERCAGLEAKIEPAAISQYQGPPRSPDTTLDCRKVQKLLSKPLPGFSQWLNERPNFRF